MIISVDIPGISINAKPRADGRYQGYATVNGEKRYFYGKTRAEVESKIAQCWKEGQDEKRREERKQKTPLFGEFAERWLKLYKAPKLKPSSLEAIKNSLKYALNRFAQKRISAISADDVQEMLLAIEGTRVRQMCQANVNQIFRKAFLQGLTKRNPCDAVELEAHKYEKKSALTVAETERVLAEAAGTKYELLYRLVLATGLRIGEALALTRSDVDFGKRTVRVSKDVVFVGGKRIVQARPKTEAANRTLPLPAGLCGELAVLEGETLFPFSYNSVRLFTERTAKKLNVKLTLHVLRHTYATRMEEAGIPPKIKQYLMGHASLKMTENVYTDTQQAYVESVSDRVREIFEPQKS